MPNITLAVSDGVYRAARIWAAAHGTTVSAVVRRILENLPDKVEDLPARITSQTEEISRPTHQLEPDILLGYLGKATRPLKSKGCSPRPGEAPASASPSACPGSSLLDGITTPSPLYTVSQSHSVRGSWPLQPMPPNPGSAPAVSKYRKGNSNSPKPATPLPRSTQFHSLTVSERSGHAGRGVQSRKRSRASKNRARKSNSAGSLTS